MSEIQAHFKLVKAFSCSPVTLPFVPRGLWESIEARAPSPRTLRFC